MSVKQQQLLKEVFRYDPGIIYEVVPDFQIDRMGGISTSQVGLILNGLKARINCGQYINGWLEPYQAEIKEMFKKSIAEINISELEMFVNKHPELNIEFAYKNFMTPYLDHPFDYSAIHEYGYQTASCCPDNRLYYLKFYDFLTIDHDHKNGMSQLEEFCRKCPSFLFNVYETHNGYHFMLMSHAIPFYDQSAVDLMYHLGCDPWYILYSHRYGFKLRLNRKNRPELYVARFLKSIGRGRPHPKCQQMEALYADHLEGGINAPGDDHGFYGQFIRDVIGWKATGEKRVMFGVDLDALIPTIRKPQQLICDHRDYYVAMDQKTRTFYVCFRELMMIDIDLHKLPSPELKGADFDITDHCRKNFEEQKSAIQIYGTHNGFHLFLIDRRRSYKDPESIEAMIKSGCDMYYSIFCHLRGFCVRLNRKRYEADRKTKSIYTYKGFYGSKDLIDPSLDDYVTMHYRLTQEYQDKITCLMK